MPRLLTIADAADELGVPKAAVRRAAEQHGFLIRMGRALRIDRQTLPELVEKCRDPQKAPAYSNAAAATTSATETDALQRAHETALRLKRRSPATSPKRAGPPARVIPLG